MSMGFVPALVVRSQFKHRNVYLSCAISVYGIRKPLNVPTRRAETMNPVVGLTTPVGTAKNPLGSDVAVKRCRNVAQSTMCAIA